MDARDSLTERESDRNCISCSVHWFGPSFVSAAVSAAISSCDSKCRSVGAIAATKRIRAVQLDKQAL
jgi:hypothetical protein